MDNIWVVVRISSSFRYGDFLISAHKDKAAAKKKQKEFVEGLPKRSQHLVVVQMVPYFEIEEAD